MKLWIELCSWGSSPDKKGLLVNVQSTQEGGVLKVQSVQLHRLFTTNMLELKAVWGPPFGDFRWHRQSVCECTVMCMN